ncbi:hypothetical protein [Streptomyces gobitricini]|uniref:Uncharacterized protein n=1 Tax=Streptomyces gobitricini TaxID=68211 RepID=A0ABN3M2R8_9ACTN
MPNDHPARTLPRSDGSARTPMAAATEMSLADEELLERYPAVRGVAERWIALRRETGDAG